MSSAGGPKDRRRAFEKELLGQLWEGKVKTATTGGVMDREHTGGEVRRLGGVGTMQASGDELVATRGTGVSRHGSHAAQRRA